jgi:hypothetical protein
MEAFFSDSGSAYPYNLNASQSGKIHSHQRPSELPKLVSRSAAACLSVQLGEQEIQSRFMCSRIQKR